MYRAWFSLVILYVLMVMTVVIAAAPTFLSYAERDALTFPVQPMPILNSPVVPGEELQIRLSRCNWSGGPLSYTLQRTLVRIESDDRRDLPTSRSGMLNGGCETVTAFVPGVPEETPPGHYLIEGIAVAAGKWKTSSVPFSTARFEVVARKEGEE
jgi:hypothetical protein